MAKMEIPAEIQHLVNETAVAKSRILCQINSSKYGKKYHRILSELCQFTQSESPHFEIFWHGLSAKERFVLGKICFDFVRGHQSFGFPAIENIIQESLAHQALQQHEQFGKKAERAIEMISDIEAYELVPLVDHLFKAGLPSVGRSWYLSRSWEELRTDFAAWVSISRIWDVYGKGIVQGKVQDGVIDFGKIDQLASHVATFSYQGHSKRITLQLLNIQIFIALAKEDLEEAILMNQTVLQLLNNLPFLNNFFPNLLSQTHYRLVSLFCELNQKLQAAGHSLELRKLAMGRNVDILGRHILSELNIAESFWEPKHLILAEKAWQTFCTLNPDRNVPLWHINVLFHLIRCKLILHQPHKIHKLLQSLSQLPKESLKPEFLIYGRIFEIIIAWDQGDIEDVKRLTKSFKAFFKRMDKQQQFPQVEVILRFFTSIRSNTTPDYEATRAKDARIELQNILPSIKAEMRVLNFKAVLEKRFNALKIVQNGNNA